jgi:hypothetical protein
MNRLFVTVLASSFLLLAGGTVSGQTARARIANTPIRGEAGLESAIIATVPEGTVLQVVDFQGDWYRVVVPAEQGVTGTPQVGYVWARLIEVKPRHRCGRGPTDQRRRRVWFNRSEGPQFLRCAARWSAIKPRNVERVESRRRCPAG